jgi:hypothetical protein
MVGAARYKSGTGLGGIFWLVVAIAAASVALSTSGVVSEAFWGVAGLFFVLTLVLVGAYMTGRGRGGWTSGGIDLPRGGPGT